MRMTPTSFPQVINDPSLRCSYRKVYVMTVLRKSQTVNFPGFRYLASCAIFCIKFKLPMQSYIIQTFAVGLFSSVLSAVLSCAPCSAYILRSNFRQISSPFLYPLVRKAEYNFYAFDIENRSQRYLPKIVPYFIPTR